MGDEIEAELLAMLQEPTADRVLRDKIRADRLMLIVGRAIAPQVNAALFELQKKIDQSKEGDNV